MAELIHVSKVRITKDKGPLRRAWIENFPDPVVYGVHGGIKEFYRVEPEQEAPAALDHLVAAGAGRMTGTPAGARAAPEIPPQPGRPRAAAERVLESVAA